MHDHGSTHNTPGWVKMTGIIVIALLLLLFVGLHVVGMSLLGHVSGGHGDRAPPSSVTEDGVQSP
jgi:hypothetical protein